MDFQTALSEFTHAKISFDEPMRKHTGYGVGGCARYYAEIDSLFGLNLLLSLTKKYKIKHKIIGNGTNMLFSDLGYDGIVIDLKKLNDVFFKRDQIRAMAGAKLEKLIRFALDHKLGGLEALSGIPATVGGAVVMNAGAFGHNISDRIVTVETLFDGKIKVYDKDECRFAYRKSRFSDGKQVVVSASFALAEAEREVVNASIKSYAEIRKKMHPNGKSCGSVFKNTKKHTAGMLIDKVGLKGYKIGGAQVSTKHGNFIVTDAHAKAKDVYELIELIKKKVEENFNVSLEEEIELVGEF